MTVLPWGAAVAAGVVTDAEADLFRACVQRNGAGTWSIDIRGLDEAQFERLSRAVAWFCSKGGVH